MPVAELGRVAARLDVEFLDVLEARLELEGRVVLAVHVPRRGIDDRRTLDAVVLDDVLFNRASAEADVLPCPRARILRTGGLQHQLRHLASVHRQAIDFALADVRADSSRADVEDRRDSDDRDGFLHSGGLQFEVERQLLANRQRHVRIIQTVESALGGLE